MSPVNPKNDLLRYFLLLGTANICLVNGISFQNPYFLRLCKDEKTTYFLTQQKAEKAEKFWESKNARRHLGGLPSKEEFMYTIWTIYFAQTSDSKRIKIGRTRKNLEKALVNLNLSEELTVLKTVKGTLTMTRDLHAEFETLQVEGLQKGWYTSSPELLARIESIEDFDGDEPPKPEPKPEYKEYKREDLPACCGCGRWLSDEYNEKPIEFLTLNESDTYIDYGEIHDEMDTMNAAGWSKSDDYLCRECVLKGGLTNLIYPLFSTIRENLSPFWTEIDENFLLMCVDTPEIHEMTRYIWLKARVFTRKCFAAFIEQNPSGDLKAAIRFILAEIRKIESGNLSEKKSNPDRL